MQRESGKREKKGVGSEWRMREEGGKRGGECQDNQGRGRKKVRDVK